MNVRLVTLVYFSPTGTTKQIVEGIAKGIHAGPTEHLDLTHPAANSHEFIEFHEEFVIIGALVYFGRIPIEAVARLERLKPNNTLAVVIVVYGNRAYEDALFRA